MWKLSQDIIEKESVFLLQYQEGSPHASSHKFEFSEVRHTCDCLTALVEYINKAGETIKRTLKLFKVVKISNTLFLAKKVNGLFGELTDERDIWTATLHNLSSKVMD